MQDESLYEESRKMGVMHRIVKVQGEGFSLVPYGVVHLVTA